MNHSVTATIIGEIAACVSMMVLLFVLMVFGYAMGPYQPSMHSETVYLEERGK